MKVGIEEWFVEEAHRQRSFQVFL